MTAERIRSGLIAFACGDALGVPWEGRVASQIDAAALDTLPRRGDWPRGATSDDTEQLVMLAENLIGSGGAGDPRAFLTRLAEAMPTMRGIGPTTLRAIARFTQDGSLHATKGASNGAIMRVLPIGWATPADAAGRRRALVDSLIRTTHGAPTALAAACAVAAMGSYALEGRSIDELIAVAMEEIEPFRLGESKIIDRAARGEWEPGELGVSIDAMDTLAAVVQVIRREEDPAAAMRRAVLLGGDTDTVAAITGGVLGCRHDTIDIPWAGRAELPAGLDALAHGLHALRA
ncbi:ADP-ribosylglycohydrolase [Thermocatellispora tengchongensis]|uniref:ADP-ribosylglycohydrolase n=1 Tax=Thermocatellispora tengchongensis TaxID=1073253 RepID=A0A840PJS7_9ACTN|nr:ADP-ribosylglycohydrolase family protein [Thermocatellispora tengchongensis]MBB5139362.1 ADP-ribosylglycohydrolase [Thermocatellispora tengchongensis]